MKDPSISEIFLRAGMFLLHNLPGKCDAALAWLSLDEPQKLLAGEIPGVRRHKVKKLSFLFCIAEISDGFRVNGEDFHSAKIFAVISWVSRTRRSLSRSCCRANMWNPALAFSPSPWGR